ncbi:hypothetical protein NT6N_31020 [Oceaniferula spumae]|uniref:Uncharacterized protein n=1 Tax=Oceaniferula spumae TaxID=2979115 RepID=A0AAT9FPJ9_9BACT
MKNSRMSKWTALVMTAVMVGGLHAEEQPDKADKEPAAVQPNKPPSNLLELLQKRRRKADMIQAMNNSKQLFLLMVEFDDDYGSFPSDTTADSDKDLKGYKGKYSNDYLGQFFAGGYVQSEEIFFAKGGSTTDKKPDNDFTTKAKTLEAGECGFAYIKGQSTSDRFGRALLCAPMIGKGLKFDPRPYNGRAIVLRIDGSVTTYPIDKNGDAILPSGKKLFDGGKDSPWGEKGFDAKNLVFPR